MSEESLSFAPGVDIMERFYFSKPEDRVGESRFLPEPVGSGEVTGLEIWSLVKRDSKADRVSLFQFAPHSNPNFSFYFSISTYFFFLFFVFKIQNYSEKN